MSMSQCSSSGTAWGTGEQLQVQVQLRHGSDRDTGREGSRAGAATPSSWLSQGAFVAGSRCLDESSALVSAAG